MSNRHIINMANSIVGVSILSMPYCFKETGIILGICLLLLSGFITKKTCMFLINSAIMSRRRSYELLAFQVFGLMGKLVMELCMIFFLMGICVSFHVVMGDLAPAIVAKYFVIDNSATLRATLLIGIVVIVILPLCLLRNLDSLASMSACSIGFYVILNGIIFSSAFGRLVSGSWIEHAFMFRFENVFFILPIMTLALSCQSNVFEIYYSIPDPDVERMETVVNQAVNLCVALYTGVGFLGYVAFVEKDIGGNIIMNFPNSSLTDGIAMFFVISLAISFPLMLFPCRTAIHSLLYKKSNQNSFDLVNFIPESKFKIITVLALSTSLGLGIMLPNIEFVLGLLGSTMGMVIALILPSLFYIQVQSKLSFNRLLAQGFMLFGLMMMVMGTYLHLTGASLSAEKLPQVNLKKDIKLENLSQQIVAPVIPKILEPVIDADKNLESTGRKEPAIPEPPSDLKEVVNPEDPKLLVDKDDRLSKLKLLNEKNFKVSPMPNGDIGDNKRDMSAPKLDMKVAEPSKVDLKLVENVLDVIKKVSSKENEEDAALQKLEVEDTLHPDAIKKEEKERAAEIPQEEIKKEDIEMQQEKILKRMEDQQLEQEHLLKEQKEILNELKIQKENIEVLGNKNDLDSDLKLKNSKAQEDKVQKLVVAAKEVLKEISNLPEETKRKEISVDNIIAVDKEQIPIAQLLESNLELENSKKLDKKVDSSVLNQPNISIKKVNQSDSVVRPKKDISSLPLIAKAPERNLTFKQQQSDAKYEKDNPQNIEIKSNRAVPIVVKNQDSFKLRDNFVQHTEERRKRDLQPLEPKKDLISPQVLTMDADAEAPLLSNDISDMNQILDEIQVGIVPKRDLKTVKEDFQNEIQGSRHLLWRASRQPDPPNIGRRKKKHKQEPDYWDEM